MSWENNRLRTVAEIEDVIGRPASVIMLKQLAALDEGCVTVLGHSPVAGFGYRDSDGVSRTTFVGGTPGFARVHSPTRISFALTEPGTPDGPASLVFLLPGAGETLRVNGSARRGAEVTFHVEQVYVHCAQAVLRSGLWHPPAQPVTAGEVAAGPLSAPGVADFLAAAPFLALSSWDAAGGSDTSPRGERGAVARILDGRTLVIADRKGNRRADTLHNLLQDDRMSFAALVPGRTGVLHVRGRAAITVDPALLEPLALRGTPPHAALLVDVEAAELTVNDAVTKARLWVPSATEVPDLVAIGSEHLAANSAKTTGALLRIAGLVPARWLRAAMNFAYRTGLRKEGYEVERATARPRPAGREDPLREVRVVEVRRETPSAVTVVLADARDDTRPFTFRPGQFFTLVDDVGGREVRRPYSASSVPGSPRLELTVKRVEGGRFSTHVHGGLAPGARLLLRGPSGAFHAEADHAEAGHDVALVAAGSGVTPMMSIIRTLLAERGKSRIALLYSNRTEEETIFAADLARLARQHPDRLSVTHVLTSRDGRLDVQRVREWAAGQPRAARFYLCGPQPLMDTTRRALAELAVPDDRVHVERYTSGPTAAATSTTPQKVLVRDGGRPLGAAVVEPGQTLLDAGLAAGLPMPYSCTVGSCGECVVKVLAGDVAQREPNCLTARQKAAGRVLACTSAPLTEVTVDIRTE